MNARLAEVERVRDDFETDRGLLERKVATLEIERNELGRAMRSNSDTCHRALERAIEDGDKELKQWLASTRTDETPRPPNPVVITKRCIAANLPPAVDKRKLSSVAAVKVASTMDERNGTEAITRFVVKGCSGRSAYAAAMPSPSERISTDGAVAAPFWAERPTIASSLLNTTA